MPITHVLVMDAHIVPVLRSAGYIVESAPTDYGDNHRLVNKRTILVLRMDGGLTLKGPDAQAVAELLLEGCRPSGVELDIRVTQTESPYQTGCDHRWKKSRPWEFFLFRPDMVCTRCGAEMDFNDSC